MEPQTKVCQNCKQSFTIESEDFEFYEKIKVPPPTWCPECRMIRRMAWRNERSLYKRVNDAPDKEHETIISIYAPELPLVVYDQPSWWSDVWDPMRYGEAYDFSRPFFVQFIELLKNVPLPALDSASLSNIINSPFCNDAWDIKDCYYSTTIGKSEECYYCFWIINDKKVFDSFRVFNSENCCECIDCDGCYRVFYSQNSVECIESYFLYDCRNCRNCFGCVGLRHKQYYIFNQPYSKKDYFKKLSELWNGSSDDVDNNHQRIKKIELTFPHRFASSSYSKNITGHHVYQSKNCIMCFDLGQVEDSKFISQCGLGVKDSYDIYNSGERVELAYDTAVTGIDVSMVLFSIYAATGFNIAYSFNVHDCKDIFGCVGLRKKKYCILNKQYTKEEYKALVPKIIEHMNSMPYIDAKGRIYKYGEFFPPELSPFAYNETMAHEYFPFTQEEAIKQGYSWKDPETKEYSISIKSKDIPDHIKEVNDSIFQETIGCEHEGKCKEQCSTAFRIIPQELEFYKKMNLPLPRFCPNCRHYQRLKQRNPLKLWHRKCQCAGKGSENQVYENTAQHFHANEHCPNEFETSYAPDRPEIVYCEACYQNEVV